MYDYKKLVYVEIDALDKAISRVLSQYDNEGIVYPCCFFSRKLISAELNYNIHDKELLVIVELLKQ